MAQSDSGDAGRSPDFKPYVPSESDLPELTLRALLLGVVMAVVLGAANAYLGMKAGMTVAATFPAAVVAMAALRLMGGSILEENIARTTGSVGEALVAGAIFTIPAFVISGVWEELHYLESTAIMLIGGTLGVLFVIALRRTLVVEAHLPFPESVAAGELVKAGQGGQTGAVYVFSAMGFAGVWELLKNSYGIQLVADHARAFVHLGTSKMEILGREYGYRGGLMLESPSVSPLLVGVGFIVGPQISAVLIAGAIAGWLVLVPVTLFLNPELTAGLTTSASWMEMSEEVWFRQVRPIAVGTMIVAAFYTLFTLRDSLFKGLSRAFRDLRAAGSAQGRGDRLDQDIAYRKVGAGIVVSAFPLFLLYWFFSGSVGGAVTLTLVMMLLGFLFAAVAGYLVGILGASNNPISGLTLSTLLIAAILMVAIGVTGESGIMGVLGVAGVVCCAAAIGGELLQDLKVGHILGGTPWRMEVANLVGVLCAGLALVYPMVVMDQVYGIGSADLPAPQAGLMALMAKGIVGGEMAWPLVISGMFLGVALILIKAPAPMLIAVGMYLPFYASAAMAVGGAIRWFLDRRMEARALPESQRSSAVNAGVLLSSGLIAGESLTAVILAFWVLGTTALGLPGLPRIAESVWLGLLIFPVLAYLLIRIPLNAARRGSAPSVRIET